jgi:hypothetical protein
MVINGFETCDDKNTSSCVGIRNFTQEETEKNEEEGVDEAEGGR